MALRRNRNLKELSRTICIKNEKVKPAKTTFTIPNWSSLLQSINNNNIYQSTNKKKM